MKIAALVLAAGCSVRYGDENKLLSSLGDDLVIERVIKAILSSEIPQVVVVTGHQSIEVSEVLSVLEKVRIVNNSHYREGMSTTISRGVRSLKDVDACMICLGDLPFITAEHYRKLTEIYVRENTTDLILIPTFQGKRGHPVIFGSRFFPELIDLPVSDQGARSVILANKRFVKEVDLGTKSILWDIDYKDLKKLDHNDG